MVASDIVTSPMRNAECRVAHHAEEIGGEDAPGTEQRQQHDQHQQHPQ